MFLLFHWWPFYSGAKRPQSAKSGFFPPQDTSAMDTRTFAHLEIQPDWKTAFSEGDRKIWISLRRKGQESIHGYLYLQRNEGSVREESQFEIVWKNESIVKVVHKTTGVSGIFVSPSQSFKLHDKRTQLFDMDISLSGGLGVAASEDGLSWIWDTDNGQIRRTLEGHYNDVNTCRFFPSGVVVLTGGADFRLKVWSAEDGSCPRTLLGHTRGISDTVLVDRGRNVISVSGDGTTRLWECGSGRCVRVLLEGESPLTSCACKQSPLATNVGGDKDGEFGVVGKLLVVTSDNGTLCAVDMSDKNPVFQKQFASGLTKCAFIGDTSVICGTETGELIETDLRNTRQPIRTLITSSEITSLQMTGNRKCITATADGSCFVWDTQRPDVDSIVNLTGPQNDRVTAVRPREGHIWTSCKDGTIRLYSDVQSYLID